MSDIEILREALQLEQEAVERYTRQREATADPRLIAFWEALRRNESDHRGELSEKIDAIDQRGST